MRYLSTKNLLEFGLLAFQINFLNSLSIICEQFPVPIQIKIGFNHNQEIIVVFFIFLYWISLISRIRWIQLESIKYDWMLL